MDMQQSSARCDAAEPDGQTHARPPLMGRSVLLLTPSGNGGVQCDLIHLEAWNLAHLSL